MGKDYLGKDQRAVRPEDEEAQKPVKALDAADIALLKTYVCEEKAQWIACAGY
jgi:hypothetical protein